MNELVLHVLVVDDDAPILRSLPVPSLRSPEYHMNRQQPTQGTRGQAGWRWVF